MKPTTLLLTSLHGLRRSPLRSCFIMLGSVVGIAALTFVLAVGRGAQRKLLSTLGQIFGDSSIIVTAGGHQIMAGPRADAARLTLDEIAAVAGQLPRITAWDPQQTVYTSVKHGNTATTARVLGHSERFERVWSRRTVRGQMFTTSDVNRSERVALIGATVARDLFGGRDPLNAEILIDSVPFTVVGVLETFGTDIHGMDRDNEVVVPISTFMHRLRTLDTILLAKFIVADGAPLEATARDVRRLLRNEHRLAASQPDDFGLITPIEAKRLAATATRVLSLYLPLASGIILAVGGLIAATLMLGAVNQRMAEIGVRRAVGAHPRDIALQFLVEAGVTLLLGGAAGIVLGALASQAVRLHIQVESRLSWDIVLLGLLLSTAVGLLAGVLPARRAANLPPVQALK